VELCNVEVPYSSKNLGSGVICTAGIKKSHSGVEKAWVFRGVAERILLYLTKDGGILIDIHAVDSLPVDVLPGVHRVSITLLYDSCLVKLCPWLH